MNYFDKYLIIKSEKLMKNDSDKMKENNLIKLRGHHLLCLQGYQGYGYDDEFEKNMTQIHEKLNKNDSTENVKIIVDNSPDDLCDCCPNLKRDICVGDIDKSNETDKNLKKANENNQNIIKLDSIVLTKTKLVKNKKYHFKDIIKIVNNTFKKLEDVQEICGDCEWTDKCLWYQSKEK